ncbi:MAG: YbhB/YbcL family Raf kinase inhibitor-like protein [Candidatus Omnitrophota bacterium]
MKRTLTIGILLSIFLTTGGESMALELKSPDFKNGAPIPAKYTCKGKDISPPLVWSDIPEGAKSIALICDDPDAPSMTWVHWVVYNIPTDTKGFQEGLPKDPELPDGTLQGITDFRTIGYGGPCPPPGGPHRYYFKLYVLDRVLVLGSGATKKMLLDAMKGHVLEETQLMGTFKR